MSAARDDATPRSATARTVALLFVALAFAGFVALGLWQLRRLDWKEDMIARIQSRIDSAPVALPAAVDPSMKYAPVYVAGGGYTSLMTTLDELLAGFGG